MSFEGTNLSLITETVHYRHGRRLPPPIFTNIHLREIVGRPGVQPNNDALSSKSNTASVGSAWLRMPSGATNPSYYLPFSARSLETAHQQNTANSLFAASELETEHIFPRFFMPPESIAEDSDIVTEAPREIVRTTGMSIAAGARDNQLPTRTTSLGVTIPPPVTVPALLLQSPSPRDVSAGTRYRDTIQDVLFKLNLPAATLDDDFDNEDNDEPLLNLVDNWRKQDERRDARPFHAPVSLPKAARPALTARDLVKTRPRRHSVEKQPVLV